MKQLWTIALAILAIDLLGPITLAQPPAPSISIPAPAPTNSTPLTTESSLTSAWTPWNCCGMPGWGMDAGVSLYFLKPYFSSNQAYTYTSNSSGTANQSAQTRYFDYNYGTTPAYWLAWTDGNGVGIRARYFSYDESAQPLYATNPGGALGPTISPPSTIASGGAGVPSFSSPGLLLKNGIGSDVLAFSSELHIQTFDIEATWDVRHGPWWLQFTGGARYLHMSQSYGATLSNTSAAGTEFDSLNTSHNFNGFGPTTAFIFHYQLYNSNLSAFGSVRGSLLVGQSDSSTSFSQTISNAGFFNQTSNPTASATQNTVIPMLEFELGLEYGLNFGRSRVYLRAAAVSQTYFDAGSAASQSGNLSLFGGQASLGFSF